MPCNSLRQIIAWNLGWLVLAAAWFGPLPYWAMQSFAAHMALHMAVVSVASPLIAIGMSGRSFDPVRQAPYFFAPLTAAVGELLIVWAWHAPRLHHYARFETHGFVLEQAMFLGAGLWVWLSAFGGDAPRTRQRSASGIVGLLLTSMHMTLLGALLALSPRVLYAHHHGLSQLSLLEDQHLGGAIMLVVGGAAFLFGGLWLTFELVDEVRQKAPPDVRC